MSGLVLDPQWLWLIGGVVLLIAELIAPGFFLVFIGGAAIATGLAALVLPLGLPLQFAIFAAWLSWRRGSVAGVRIRCASTIRRTHSSTIGQAPSWPGGGR